VNEIQQFLLSLLPGFTRAFGFLLLLPLGEGTTLASRSLLAVGVGLVLSRHLPPSEAQLVLGALEGFLIGVLVAVPIALTVEGASSLGELVDAGRGQLMAQTFDPAMNITQSLLGHAFRVGYWMILLERGVVESSLRVLIASSALSPFSPCVSKVTFLAITQILMLIVLLSLVFAAAFMTIELGFGFAAHIVKGMSLSNATFLFKLLITVSILYLASFLPITLPEIPGPALCLSSNSP
jgi:flagellar biosynthesis protein FliR